MSEKNKRKIQVEVALFTLKLIIEGKLRFHENSAVSADDFPDAERFTKEAEKEIALSELEVIEGYLDR